jgi:hypothetical protein
MITQSYTRYRTAVRPDPLKIAVSLSDRNGPSKLPPSEN